jgi:hypothetical protein
LREPECTATSAVAVDEIEATRARVDRVVDATTRRRRLPRIHVEFPTTDSY